MYTVQKNLTRLKNKQATFFLDPKELKEITSKLKKNEYSIYSPYLDSEKKIIYNYQLPEVLLYEIIIKSEVRHQDILGSLYATGIDNHLFGDILIINNRYYIYILKIVRNYFETNFKMVKNSYVTLKELDIDYLKDHKRDYEEIEIIVSSLRCDTVISTLIHCGRNNIKDLIKKKEIIFNYDFLKSSSFKMSIGDTFSIKKIGKFKYIGIKSCTKSNNLVIKLAKYI